MAEKIRIENGRLTVPHSPIIRYIEGDGTGRDIWKASVRVFDAAVEKAYDSKRKVSWKEVLAGEKGETAANEVQKRAELEGKIIIKDVIADAFLQQILTRPAEYSVIATLNLNGDYISDALAAIVGGIGIAPGANINYETGHAIFEATHGMVPKYAGLDKVNPGSVILSGALMFVYLGWIEAANKIYHGLEKTIQNKMVTYDFHRLTENAQLLKTSEFADAIISAI